MSITTEAPVAVTGDERANSHELRASLDDLAYEVAEQGTASRRPTLEMLASATRRVVPGAAAALVDWAGSEIARLRAFAMVRRTVTYELDEDERASVLMRMPAAVAFRLVA